MQKEFRPDAGLTEAMKHSTADGPGGQLRGDLSAQSAYRLPFLCTWIRARVLPSFLFGEIMGVDSPHFSPVLLSTVLSQLTATLVQGKETILHLPRERAEPSDGAARQEQALKVQCWASFRACVFIPLCRNLFSIEIPIFFSSSFLYVNVIFKQ